jgi:hypothetical protein
MQEPITSLTDACGPLCAHKKSFVVLNNGITLLAPFDIEFERRANRPVYVPVRELAHDAQALMLIGHEHGTSAIASVLAELLKTRMREATG